MSLFARTPEDIIIQFHAFAQSRKKKLLLTSSFLPVSLPVRMKQLVSPLDGLL